VKSERTRGILLALAAAAALLLVNQQSATKRTTVSSVSFDLGSPTINGGKPCGCN
jgi:hypothetical protein